MKRAHSIIALSLIALASLREFLKFYHWNFDDGMIVARIIRNIVEGFGWRYNIDQNLNASTSVLNTGLGAALSALGMAPPLALHLIGFLALLVGGWCLYLVLLREFPHPLALLAAAILVFALGENSTWGLETNLFCALLLAFVAAVDRYPYNYGLLALLALIRPDGALLAGFKGVRDFVRQRRVPLKGSVLFALILLPWVIFSWYQFEEVFPNSLKNKIWQGNSGMWGPGRVYLRAFTENAKSMPIYSWLLAFPGVYWQLRKRSALLYLALFAVLQQAVYCYLNVPGYHWYFSLFNAALLIAALSGASFLLSCLPFSRSRFVAATAPALLALLVIWSLVTLQQVRDPRDENYRATVMAFEAAGVAAGEIGSVETGTIGYWTDRKILDLTGLTSQNPEFISGRNTDLYYQAPARHLFFHHPLWHFENALRDDIRFDLLYQHAAKIDTERFGMRIYSLREGASSLSRKELHALLRSKFGGFAPLSKGLEAATVLPESCVLDYVNGQFTKEKRISARHGVLRARGWVVRRTPDKLIEEISLALLSADGKQAFQLSGKRSEREDVAKALALPAHHRAGAEFEGHTLDLPVGEYKVILLQHEGEQVFACDSAIVLELKD